MDIKIINGKFYTDGVISNYSNYLSEGKLIGVYTDMCSFFDSRITDITRNKRKFTENLNLWRKSGINLITAGLQSPNPFEEYYKKAREQDKSKDISFNSSALKSDGSLDYDYLENVEEIIKSANDSGLAVLVNILSPSCEDIFEDEFAVINGIFNAADWLLEKKFSNVLANITDVSHTFYKSSVLNGDKIIYVLKSLREKAKDNIILGTGIKSLSNINEKNIKEYIELSDFIPIYAEYAKSNHNTKKMLEKIYFFKENMKKMGEKSREVPLIMVKGDDLSERYNSYGKNNLTEALENNISWCYYDKDGFVIQPINWDKNSSPEKKRFFELSQNIENI